MNLQFITIYSDFVFACLINSRITTYMYLLFTCKYQLKIITFTHKLSFSKESANNICYFNLIICCKILEGGADLEGPLIFQLFHAQ